MRQPLQATEGSPLNPFAFPSETSMRFLLLLLIIGGSVYTMASLIVWLWFKDLSLYVPFGLMITAVVFGLAWLWARQYAGNKIIKEQWQSFPPADGDPLKQASLQQMKEYIGQITDRLPELDGSSPRFVWDAVSPASRLPTGLAFGFGREQYIGLREGLHPAFVQLPQSQTFNAVLLHELGHIGNRDVSKTVYSVVIGRCFYLVMVPMLGFLNLLLLRGGYNIVVQQSGPSNFWAAAGLIASINLKFLLIFFLIAAVRSSILRVREHYADARAVSWLGAAEPLLKIMSAHSSQSHTIPPEAHRQAGLTIAKVKHWLTDTWRKAWTWFAPMHPTPEKRTQLLRDMGQLFQLNWGIAFLAALLSGLSLNSNGWAISLILEGDNLLQSLNQFVQSSQHFIAVIIGATSYLLLEFFLWTGIIAVFVIFGLLPIVGTVGLEIQKTALSDRLQPDSHRRVSLLRLIGLAATMGAGFVAGGWLTPMPHFLSLPGWRLFLAPFYIFGWTAVFLVWLLPLRWLAGVLFARHTGYTRPTCKLVGITTLSAVALTPLLITASFFQAATGVSLFWIGLATGAVMIAFVLHWLVWGAGWFSMKAAGWLEQPRCPGCKEQVADLTNKTCSTCHEPTSAWAWLDTPLSLPLPPDLKKPATAVPPPL